MTEALEEWHAVAASHDVARLVALINEHAVFEFETEVDGIAINDVDIIYFTPDGERIAHFKVMIRPLKAIEVVHRMMGKALTRQ